MCKLCQKIIKIRGGGIFKPTIEPLVRIVFIVKKKNRFYSLWKWSNNEIKMLLWAGSCRPIIWNKNLRSLCVSAVWMLYILTLGKPRPIRTSSGLHVVHGICQGLTSDILSIYIILYFNGQYWLYTWYFILYVKKFGGFFNICCSFTLVTCYLYRSLCMIYV